MSAFKTLLLCSTLLSISTSFAFADKAPVETPKPIEQTSAQPLEVTADTALEWDRTNKKYYARGHAMAKQNDFQVEGDKLTADYRENPEGGGTQIYRLTAEGHVILTNGLNKGYGEHAIYEVDDAKATLTGGNDLRIETPDMKITAKEKFEYYSNEGKMIAYGSPVITNKDSVLTADLVTAWTAPKTSKTETPLATAPTEAPASKFKGLKRAEATGHVVITTPKEKATSDKAIYTGENDTVELQDNVKLTQGENILEGNRADMNLTTKLSRMYGAPGKGGRVKGVFFPSSKKTPAKNEQITSNSGH